MITIQCKFQPAFGCAQGACRLKYTTVTVGTDKPLARLIVVRRLSVDKGQVLWSGMIYRQSPIFLFLTKSFF